jgi:lipopolysaccharide/colanic/teichoic acid biosynthesis glycosyltransferase
LIPEQPRRARTYRGGGKRAFDVVAASALLIVSAPIQGVVAGLVRAKLGSPVLFKQERPGLNGQTFQILKFRTMTSATDEKGQPLPDDVRVTRFGQLLRSTSLDELPELWNVVKGQMSMVGPRPLLMHYLPRYTPEQARRHEVRPGITGWAQVNGRNSASWKDKLEMDTWYVDNVSLGLDLQILARTLRTVFTRIGISTEGHATAPEFLGQASDDD